MATFYLDFENGNDANNGTSWALAWKSLNAGATAARIAPGDTIRIAKSGDPTSIGNATWTSKSATVTLASAQTTSIYLDGAWTAANIATTTTTTTRKEGATASSITTPATTNTATKYAYYATGTLDLSSYDAITFFFRNNTSAVADSNRYQIKLCSDTTGDTAVDTFDIPAIPTTSSFIAFTLKRNGGGNLGNNIASIALYTGSSSPGNSQVVIIDNVLGCSSTGLSLTSLISKNSAAYGGTDTWHTLQSIAGTTVILGNLMSATTGSTTLRGYYTTGTSPETVTTYIRPTIKFPMSSNTGATTQPIQDSGNASSYITFSGGWNTSNTTQDGETWVDGQNGTAYFLGPNGNNYLTFERINPVKFSRGIDFSTSCIANVNMIIVSCDSSSIAFSSGTITISTNNCSSGLQNTPATTTNNCIYNLKSLNQASATVPGGTFIKLIHNNNSGVLTLNKDSVINYLEILDNGNANAQNLNFNVYGYYYIQEAVIKNNTATNTLYSTNYADVVINKLTASGNTNIGSFYGILNVKQTNAASTQLLGNGASPVSSRNYQYPALSYGAVNNDVNDNRTYWSYGNALTQTTTRHTASGVAWQINITDTLQTSDRPFYLPIAKVACNANKLVTVKAWVKLSNATNIGAKLMIQNNEIAGVSADITATKSADTNWEELQITFTPTVAGVAQIYLQAYWLASTANQSVYVDDITVTQA